jgi:imidazolonepropionase-like amidohydrolase
MQNTFAVKTGHKTLLNIALVILVVPSVSKTAYADTFVIRNARVFDGHRIIQNSDVWIDEGLIRAIGTRLEVPSGLTEVEGAGHTLLPGLIDAHTHAWSDALQKALVFGVTTELDMFTDVKYMQQAKQEQKENNATGRADLFSAGTLATAQGGHGTQYGFPIPTIASPADALAWVHSRVLEGSDYIKIVYDDCRIYGTSRPTLSLETMRAVIEGAHQHGKLAVVHIGTQQQARDAIEAGADGLAHLFTDSVPAADFASLAAEHKLFVIPTLTVLEGLNGTPSGESLATDDRLLPYLYPSDIVQLRRAFPPRVALREQYAEQTVRALIAAHVPVLAGSDSPNPGTSHGASIHRELELLVRAGITPAQALTAATSAPAAAFRLSDRGEIAPGKRADLVLVKGDPMSDITTTRAIVAVWKIGVQVDRKQFAMEVKEDSRTKAAAKPAASPLSESKLISDFEDGKLSAKFGKGWSVSTDSIAGGKSTAEMKSATDGANASKHSLQVSGEISGQVPFAWSGVMFSPGQEIFKAVDLSSKKQLSFFAKGDGQTYRVMIFTESGGRIPAQQTFSAPKAWREYTFDLSAFNGTDGHDLSAILFVAGPAPGKFVFSIDEITLR